jgi:LysW-gamma-L-alpha-aminoadipyl-6-phosphate/LysW-L-glutamyl-5-phosphate reductase
MINVGIVGGSGYTGGELLRILLRHPNVNIEIITSERYAGKRVSLINPNLRGVTDLRFSSRNDLGNYDLLFICTPHGVSMKNMPSYLEQAQRVIDLSGDYRLRNPQDYIDWYNTEHPHPELLAQAVYGIPELHREEIKTARLVTGAGCLATATILALYPLRNIIETVVVDAKIGSAAAGNKSSLGSHHPERTGTVRAFKATMHRHTAEMQQELGTRVDFSAHAIQLVRGISSTCHVFLKEDLTERDIWTLFREQYGNEPFIRIVKDRQGVYRYPEPKILTGSNYCDIGFERDRGNRLVVFSAIDNLMKGAAGQAVQCMNIMFDFPETLGLEAIGFHPI